VRRIADAGALIIADEVQPGLGRCGTHMWAFQRLGLRPDIVVLGKSLGNGYPIGALVARAELIDAFYRQERYFNTCAGSQLAAAAGCATLDVIEDQQLIQNAQRVGQLLKVGLQELSLEDSIIRSVRGAGLLLGVDLAPPPGSAEPAGAFASRFVTDLLDLGVVVGLTGPDRRARTVLKIRPPMVFDEPAVSVFLDCFRAALRRIDR
jgi:4-aminobutyrate aminotransferase-like enzyme